MKAYHIILENGNVKENIEPIFLSKENAEKRVKDLTSAIEYDHNNKTKYYIEETELNCQPTGEIDVDWEKLTEGMRDKNGWLDLGRGLKMDRDGNIAGGLKM